MLCRATEARWVIVKSSNKTWSTGGGNGNPLKQLSSSSSSRMEAGNIPNELGVSCVPKVRKYLKHTPCLLPPTHNGGGLTNKPPEDQSWNILSNKVNNIVLDYNRKYKINNHESILI